MEKELRQKYERLLYILKRAGRACVAYSGGVDSTFLLYAALRALGAENVLAVMADGSFVMRRELEAALENAKKIGIQPLVIKADEFSVKEFRENPPERCYYCKKNIFSRIISEASKRGFKTIFDGSNKDDQGDFRPGLKALLELGVKSPLKEAGLSKNEIRALSSEALLPTAQAPSRACLASRIPYGTPITPELLLKVERAEDFLIGRGFGDVRVRLFEHVAVIEVPPSGMQKIIAQRSEISEALKEIGILYAALDLKGRRTGSLNEMLGPDRISAS